MHVASDTSPTVPNGGGGAMSPAKYAVDLAVADSGLRVRGGGIDTHRPKASVTKPKASWGEVLKGCPPSTVRKINKMKLILVVFWGYVK